MTTHRYRLVIRRRVVMRRFPYGVFYEIHGTDVVVLGCMHGARDPEEWQKRAAPR